jgi:hypothetical protein
MRREAAPRLCRAEQQVCQPTDAVGAPAEVGNRVALARAMALGLGVVETANATPAAAEITALAEEVRGPESRARN